MSKATAKIPTSTKSGSGGKAGLYAKEFGVSGMMGAAVGVATRRLTSDALYGAGLCFVGLQTLAYLGFISIQWSAIGNAISDLCDQNGDGKLDMEDVKIFFKKAMSYLSRGLPDAAGFTSGFFIGVKYLA